MMENSTPLLISQVMHSYIQSSMSLFKEFQLHPGQAVLLRILTVKSGLSQKELAGKLGVKPPSITAMLKKLEAERYIEKVQDENDQRVTRIYITDSGLEIAGEVDVALNKLEDRAFANMSEEEVMLLRRLLLQMRENLKGEKETGIFKNFP